MPVTYKCDGCHQTYKARTSVDIEDALVLCHQCENHLDTIARYKNERAQAWETQCRLEPVARGRMAYKAARDAACKRQEAAKAAHDARVEEILGGSPIRDHEPTVHELFVADMEVRKGFGKGNLYVREAVDIAGDADIKLYNDLEARIKALDTMIQGYHKRSPDAGYVQAQIQQAREAKKAQNTVTLGGTKHKWRTK